MKAMVDGKTVFVCDVCDARAQGQDRFNEFVMLPVPQGGPDYGKIFPGVGVVRDGKRVPAVLLFCPNCAPKMRRMLKTNDITGLPLGRLKKLLEKIQINHRLKSLRLT